MNLFGRPKREAPPPTQTAPSSSAPPTNTTQAIAKLRDAAETLEKREEHIERKIDNEIKQAKQFSAAGKKREALNCIKRKKMYEKQLEHMGQTKITLETQRLALENLSINRETLEAQRVGAAALQSETRRMGGVEAVEDTMDSVEEGLADANEIGEAMSRTVGDADEDEDELLAELEGLTEEDDAALTHVETSEKKSSEEDELAAELGALVAPSAPTNKAFPSAPTQAMTDEERELAELERSMAM